MDTINNLLEKYFDGLTSTEEEKMVKSYFKGDGVLPEHEVYKPFFAVFDKEKEGKAPAKFFPGQEEKQSKTDERHFLKREEKQTNAPEEYFPEQEKRSPITRRIAVLMAGAAAVILAALVLFPLFRERPEYVVIMNGKPITDANAARQYANETITLTRQMIEESYRPFIEVDQSAADMNADKMFNTVNEKIKSIKSEFIHF